MSRLFDQIPGLREAIDNDRRFELEAFVGLEPSICGTVYLKPFTPRMHLELWSANNGYVSGEHSPSVADALQLLWRCSEVFSRDDVEKRSKFWQVCSLLPAEDVHREISEYLVRAWRSTPFGQPGPESFSSVASWSSTLIHLIASEYGWDENVILDTPFRRLFQYIHRILERRDPDHRQVSQEAMRLRADYIQRKTNERQAKGQK